MRRTQKNILDAHRNFENFKIIQPISKLVVARSAAGALRFGDGNEIDLVAGDAQDHHSCMESS
jgi:hypothetical protein